MCETLSEARLTALCRSQQRTAEKVGRVLEMEREDPVTNQENRMKYFIELQT